MWLKNPWGNSTISPIHLIYIHDRNSSNYLYHFKEHGRNQDRKESVSRNSAEEDEGPSTSVVDDSETDDEFSEGKWCTT